MNNKRLLYPTGFLRRSRQNMACLAVLFCLVILMPGALWAAPDTYQVDETSGDDLNDGITAPWQTLAKVSGHLFNPGDQILFKRGEVWNEPLTILSSGTALNPITFGAYGTGGLPIFDGTNNTGTWAPSVSLANVYTATPPWLSGDPGMIVYKGTAKPSIATLTFDSDVSGIIKANAVLIQKGGAYSNFWVTAVDPNPTGKVYGITFFRNSNHWVKSTSTSIELRQLDGSGHEVKTKNFHLASSGLTVDEKSLQKDGDWYWDTDTLYLYSSTTPNSTDIQVSALETGIYAQGQQNLIIQDIAVQGFQGTGVHLDRTVDSIVRRMQVTNIGAETTSHKSGIMLDHSSSNTIQNNTIDSVLRVGIGIYSVSSANPSQDNTVIGNTIKNSGSSGVSLNTDDSTTSSNVTGNTITGNTILYANRLAYDSAGVYAIFVGTGNSITNNTILFGGSKYLRSAGIMVDWGDDGRPPVVAPVIITGNRLENNSLGGIVVTGTGHTITSNRLTYNGLASWPSAQLVFFPVVENVSGSTVRNNVVEAETGKYLFLETIVSNWSNPINAIDSNTYRSRSASTFCQNDWSGSGVCGWVNFSTWKSTTGHDTNSSFSFITDPPPPDIKSINSTYLLLL